MTPNIGSIQARVARFYGLPLEIMRSPSKRREHVYPRQVAMYLARRLSGRSLPVIGYQFRRDHTTVIHAIRAVEGRCKSSELTRSLVSMLEKELSPDYILPGDCSTAPIDLDEVSL